MKNSKDAYHWLERAESNFELAKVGRISKKIVYDDLCYECQQSIEKSLKAVLIFSGRNYEKTHSIAHLFELLKNTDLSIPKTLFPAKALTPYAVMNRYPGSYDPASSTDYKQALVMADKVLKWAKSIIHPKQDKLF